MMRTIGLFLVLLGVVANNVVYLQDVWLGSQISLDSWRAYLGLLGSVLLVLVGAAMMFFARPSR